MDTIRQVMLAACFTGIALSAANASAIGERLRGQLGFLFALVFAISVLAPIASGSTDISLDFPTVSDEALSLESSERQNGLILRRVEKNLEDTARAALLNAGIVCEEIDVSANICDESGISISRASVSCSDFDAARAILSEILGSNVPITEVNANAAAD